MHFGSLTDNSGALSKTGLVHPFFFSVWGVLTYATLYLLIDAAYRKWTKYKFYHILMAVSGAGMLLTLTCDFDYNQYLQWLLHCFGSLLFSSVTGITVFLLFLLCYKTNTYFKIMTFFIAAVLLTDMILLIKYQETALIEAVPILIGYFVLSLTICRKEEISVAAGTRT